MPSLLSKEKQSFRDLPISFRIHPSREDITPLIDDDAIQQSVKNLILTNIGERPFSLIGGNVTAFLFEPVNSITITSIQSAIEETLLQYEPRIDLNFVDVNLSNDQISYEVTISYQIVGLEKEFETNLILNRIK